MVKITDLPKLKKEETAVSATIAATKEEKCD
jgi:hypothetical protein